MHDSINSKMTIIALSLWSIATVYSSSVIADVWRDYEPLVPALEVEVVQEERQLWERNWVARIFNGYYIAAWNRRERWQRTRPEYYMTPFLTKEKTEKNYDY